MHRLLARQLRKLGLDPARPPDAQGWSGLLTLIDTTYREEDQTRYTLERANAISAEELSTHLSSLQIKSSSQQAHLSTIVATLKELIWLKDSEGVYLACNQMFERFTGLRETQVIGRTDQDLRSIDTAGLLTKLNPFPHGDAVPRVFETWSRTGGEGQQVLLEVSLTPVFRDSELIGMMGLGRDVTDARQAEGRIRNLAYFDALTGLPNRLLARDRIEQAMLAGARNGNNGALLFIDLDQFKLLNDTLGHDVGDLLLKQVAHTLTHCVRKSDTVARIGGDEFVVVLPDLVADDEHAAAEVETVCRKIVAAFDQPFVINGRIHRSTPSIGATLFKGQGAGVDTLLKQADLAMYRSKEAGRNTFCFFDPSLESAIALRVQTENDLRSALSGGQLLLHYQAQVNHTGRLTGCEVLVRWQHPRRGLVAPMEFIPVAEATGLIVPIGQWVLEEACSQLASWATQADLMHLTISVNVSALQFRRPQFPDEVLATLARTGADPARLKLELTESLLMSDAEEVIAKMHLLSSHGIGLALDDFGIGYSSFSYLKRLPLAQLKIDQSFVRDMLSSDEDASIVRSIINLTSNLKLDVIAEGVETVRQLAFLHEAGCRDYQGYLFSHPVPLDQFLLLVATAAAGGVHVKMPVQT
ncbi:MAG: putative bifunctional diguanylate cyclase/phosphodiesterase [Curvibacter sp.]